ncbi:MAG: SigE family RNA polymerase sigma factor, partial [Nocardioidaceae bacterium]|nr:SigE family RNA polymerase sigma factor [Nocardioidaceae bacterium]
MQDSSGPDSFVQFVRSRFAALSHTAFLLTGDHHRSEDLLQTALFKAARSWSKIEDSPEAYVRRILYNENVSWWRRRRVSEVSLSAAGDRGILDADIDSRMALMQALAKLTAKQRTVLVLRFFEDLTEAQTASALGIGVGTVKSTSRQALGALGGWISSALLLSPAVVAHVAATDAIPGNPNLRT